MTQEKILIVEGDITSSEMLFTQLQAAGYLVSCVNNADDALSVLKNEWIDLIVLSVVLQPGPSGFELFKEIKADGELAKIPIIVRSSKPAMKQTFEMMGVDAFVVKPYPIKALLDKVKNILKKKIKGY